MAEHSKTLYQKHLHDKKATNELRVAFSDGEKVEKLQSTSISGGWSSRKMLKSSNYSRIDLFAGSYSILLQNYGKEIADELCEHTVLITILQDIDIIKLANYKLQAMTTEVVMYTSKI
ncbi:hypothetical protein LOAG_02802 [Loa loa]|uniref:Uncharacterized protein n=1 Tax=Loa loa TaxID=7209 RepID=A0A1S0U5S5_LOALO|nr:hypothetical protein LOAG_02802 [Loa loa]EFO25688.1 hypothetical protein LOAG_02802 [Loa loa]